MSLSHGDRSGDNRKIPYPASVLHSTPLMHYPIQLTNADFDFVLGSSQSALLEACGM